jgi:Fic family protein
MPQLLDAADFGNSFAEFTTLTVEDRTLANLDPDPSSLSTKHQMLQFCSATKALHTAAMVHQPLSVVLLCRIHGIMMGGSTLGRDAGEIRTTDVCAGGRGGSTHVFVPPAHVHAALDALIAEYNTDKKCHPRDRSVHDRQVERPGTSRVTFNPDVDVKFIEGPSCTKCIRRRSRWGAFRKRSTPIKDIDAFLERRRHPIQRAALLLYQLLSIHPFRNGNGRLARLFASWSLVRDGFPFAVALSFGHRSAQRHYLHAIDRARGFVYGAKQTLAELNAIVLVSLARVFANLLDGELVPVDSNTV